MSDKKLHAWARDVKKRDRRCKACGTKKNLEAHHIYPKSLYPKRKYDLDNGVALCRNCHRESFLAYHAIFGYKGNIFKYRFWLLIRKIYLFLLYIALPIFIVVLLWVIFVQDYDLTLNTHDVKGFIFNLFETIKEHLPKITITF